MKCPIDQTTLAITERQGIEIDYCPECRGVWLDRGELDKIIEGSSAAAPRPTAAPTRDAHEDRRPQQQYRSDDDYKFKKKKKESFLGDLFDF